MKQQIYSLDIYTRIVLTIIAFCLMMLAFRPTIRPKEAVAYERHAMNEPKYPRINLNIGQIGGQDLEPASSCSRSKL